MKYSAIFFIVILNLICISGSAQSDLQANQESLSSGIKEAMAVKLKKMLAVADNKVEEEIMQRCHDVLVWGKLNGRWPDVEMEDLMAHALQESKGEHAKMEQKGIQGKDIWKFHSHPSNDLAGLISWSVFQPVTANYLEHGGKFNSDLALLYEKYVSSYNASVWNFASKIREAKGTEVADKLFSELVAKMDTILYENPDLHVKVISELVQMHYDNSGVRTPNAIREYFWLMIQKNLNPENWNSPVRFKDDKMPSAENNYTDNNAHKRGDYGKQIVLGNFYNDRGMIYWYAVTGDYDRLNKLIVAWEADPAKLITADYTMLRDKGYLQYVKKYYSFYDSIIVRLTSLEREKN